MFLIDEFDFHNKKVIVRVDFNVPVKDNVIQDDRRIKSALPTINLLLEKGAKQIVLMSHFGRPKGEVNPEFSLKPIAKRLSELMAKEVNFVDDCMNSKLADSKIILLENLRFYKEEKKDDVDFARKLASYADVYVNDAFGTCHRAHASVRAITEFLPSIPGKLLEKEIENLSFNDINRPFVFILGGAKLDTKIPIIENMLDKADTILLGGAMIFDFYKAKGLEIGDSLCDDEMIKGAKDLIDKAGDKLVLPKDIVVAKEFSNEAENKTVLVGEIEQGWRGLDIGKKSIQEFSEILNNAKTVVWNGPMGVFEFENFAKGTFELAKLLGDLDAVTIIGGGDSASAVDKMGLDDKFTHVSTGGGASLEMLSGKKLPAIRALEDNYAKFS